MILPKLILNTALTDSEFERFGATWIRQVMQFVQYRGIAGPVTFEATPSTQQDEREKQAASA